MSGRCFWCNPSDVADAETKPFGIRRIARDLRKFSVSLDVFQFSIGKLSADFLADLRICSLEAEKTAMLKEDRVEQCNQDRFYVEYMTSKVPSHFSEYFQSRLDSMPFLKEPFYNPHGSDIENKDYTRKDVRQWKGG